MDIIDFILNLAGLLLWLNWRTLPLDPLSSATPATLIGTLRRAEPSRYRRWHYAAALTVLLVMRAGFYRVIGPAVEWTGTLNLVATQLAFRSDALNLMFLYSLLSFGLLLGNFVLWLLLLSLLLPAGGANQLMFRLARAHLGFVTGWPAGRKLLLPFVLGFSLWWLLSWPLARWGLMPQPISELSRLAQGALVGLSAYFSWQYLIAALLTVYLLHNYLYFGRHPGWDSLDAAARRLLAPMRYLPMRVGKVDFTPVVGITVLFLLAHLVEHGLRPPLQLDPLTGRPEPPAWEIPGLQQRYEHLLR